jgi:putative ATP-dependent endonuclease of OLD family
MTYIDETPFHQIGKGEQSVIKTNLALSHNKAKQASTLLIEEPENHLSHTNLNRLIKTIKDNCQEKQIIITTHSSFVANKLGLKDLLLLNNKNILKLNELSNETYSFFEKLSGYDTLRLILCKKAILVEGDSDELIIQKAYKTRHNKMPIDDGIEVISVGTSFLRFLEIAEKLDIITCVVTDNDGDIDALELKYNNYLKNNKKENIKICYDSKIAVGGLKIGGEPFNYNTLEPNLVRENNLAVLNAILEKDYKTIDELHIHMKRNKTDCALKIFLTERPINFPQYILDSIE